LINAKVPMHLQLCKDTIVGVRIMPPTRPGVAALRAARAILQTNVEILKRGYTPI